MRLVFFQEAFIVFAGCNTPSPSLRKTGGGEIGLILLEQAILIQFQG